jgi:hypothetical protein
MPFRGRRGNAKRRGGFVDGHANEVPEFDEVGFCWIDGGKFLQCLDGAGDFRLLCV